jgi:GLPGLI family protein
MVKLLLSVFIYLIIQTSAFSQKELKGEIEYVVTFKSFDKEKLNKMSIGTRELLNNISPVEATLYFSQKGSIYKVKEGAKNEADHLVNITTILAGNKDLYYYDRNENKIFRKTSTSGTTFLVEYPPVEWEILKETKEILGHTCYKAITVNQQDSSDQIIAWFAPEISIGLGPLFYNGLPGLIMQLETSKGTFRVSSINFDNYQEVSQPGDGKIITKEEYDLILKKLAPSFFKE